MHCVQMTEASQLSTVIYVDKLQLSGCLNHFMECISKLTFLVRVLGMSVVVMVVGFIFCFFSPLLPAESSLPVVLGFPGIP